MKPHPRALVAVNSGTPTIQVPKDWIVLDKGTDTELISLRGEGISQDEALKIVETAVYGKSKE